MRQGIGDAKEEKWFVRAQPSYKPTLISGWAHMATQVTVIIEARGSRAGKAIISYATALSIPLEKVIVRLDGLYGNTAPLRDFLGLGLAVIGRVP